MKSDIEAQEKRLSATSTDMDSDSEAARDLQLPRPHQILPKERKPMESRRNRIRAIKIAVVGVLSVSLVAGIVVTIQDRQKNSILNEKERNHSTFAEANPPTKTVCEVPEDVTVSPREPPQVSTTKVRREICKPEDSCIYGKTRDELELLEEDFGGRCGSPNYDLWDQLYRSRARELDVPFRISVFCIDHTKVRFHGRRRNVTVFLNLANSNVRSIMWLCPVNLKFVNAEENGEGKLRVLQAPVDGSCMTGWKIQVLPKATDEWLDWAVCHKLRDEWVPPHHLLRCSQDGSLLPGWDVREASKWTVCPGMERFGSEPNIIIEQEYWERDEDPNDGR